MIAAEMILFVASSLAATLTVGPAGVYPTPCAAIAAAAAGDVIDVDAAGEYAGDSCAWSTDNLTVRGVNGRATLDGTGAAMAQEKGIFVIQAPTATIENLNFIGASVADQNGAGIRHQGTNLIVRDCLFRDNQNGILGSPAEDGTGNVEIVRSEFDHNGAGDGYSHNLYLGHYASVVFRSSYSHRGNVGHLFKSRALRNVILVSRLTDEEGGTASYEIDLPNAGDAWIIGSIVEQVSTTSNNALVSYGLEPSGMNPNHALHVINSTLANHHNRGLFLSIGAAMEVPAEVVNTVFSGPGSISAQATTVFTTSWDDTDGDPEFTNGAQLDFTLAATSLLIDAGSDPGQNAPQAEYVHPANEWPRNLVSDVWDIGAFEFGNEGVPDDPLDTGDTVDTAEEDSAGEGAGDSVNTPMPDCGCDAGGGAGLGALVAAGLLAARRRAA